MRLLTSMLLGCVLGHHLSAPVRPKKFPTKTLRESNPIKTYNWPEGSWHYLIGLSAGQCFFQPSLAQQKSTKTFQKPNPIKTYKGHKSPDIYLIRLGVGPYFSKLARPQTISTKIVSGIQSYQYLQGPWGSWHPSYLAGCCAMKFPNQPGSKKK